MEPEATVEQCIVNEAPSAQCSELIACARRGQASRSLPGATSPECSPFHGIIVRESTYCGEPRTESAIVCVRPGIPIMCYYEVCGRVLSVEELESKDDLELGPNSGSE